MEKKKSSTNYGGLELRGSIWHMRFMVKGQRVNESTKTGNRRQAESIMAKKRASLVEQVVLAGKKPIKLHAAIDLFLASREHLSSHQGCSIHLGYFREIENDYLDLVTDEALQELLIKKRREDYAESTLKVSVTYFNAMLNYVNGLGYTVRKKMKPIKHNSRRLRWLTDDEYQKLLAALDPELGRTATLKAQKQENLDLVQLLYETGARRSEITSMSWTQVDLQKETVFINRLKDSISGTLHMTQTMKEIFTRRHAEKTDNWVFSSKTASKNEGRWFGEAVKRAGIDDTQGKIVVHTLRHTCAVHMLQGGLGLLELKTFLGHKNIESTMVYAHIVEGDVMKKAMMLADAKRKPVPQRAPEPAPKPLLRAV